MTCPDLLHNAIERNAVKFDLGFDLVAAIVLRESAGDVRARRFEPSFYAQYLDGKEVTSIPAWRKPEPKYPRTPVSNETERCDRAYSWGPMQVMGQTVREYGFKGYFDELLTLECGLSWGCTILKKKLQARKSFRQGVASYNGGGAAADAYADWIIKVIQTKKYEVLFQ